MRRANSKKKTGGEPDAAELRIIGGNFRGRKLHYGGFEQGGQRVTRPMKDRVREAIFNLISTDAKGKHAIDLFAGTGALGLEALSRGAARATFIEKHVPTSRIVAQNITELEVDNRCELLTTSAFLWGKRNLPTVDRSLPWLIFCSPPYAFYHDRQTEMLELVCAVLDSAPAESIVVVEADVAFDFNLLPGDANKKRHGATWQVRSYPPAVVGVWRGKGSDVGGQGSGNETDHDAP